MHIVDPSVELIGIELPARLTENGIEIRSMNPERLIEEAGRTCYKSEGLMTEDSFRPFVQKIQRLGHESVVEHSAVTLRIVCDRGVSHEIVRHRLCAYSQESTRYCNYLKEKFGSEITVIEPPDLTKRQRIVWAWAMRQLDRAYRVLIKLGASPQIARSVLPQSLKTEVVWTCNLREWKHVVRMRTSPKAHPQMIQIAVMIEAIMKRVAPDIFNPQEPYMDHFLSALEEKHERPLRLHDAARDLLSFDPTDVMDAGRLPALDDPALEWRYLEEVMARLENAVRDMET